MNDLIIAIVLSVLNPHPDGLTFLLIPVGAFAAAWIAFPQAKLVLGSEPVEGEEP